MARSPVEEIKERLSIIEVVGSYVELHKAGKSYKGKSPFTNEKTPSFFVSPDRGMYYCFSSQKGGDIFTFIQEMEGVDFKGALKILADRANVELVPEDPKKRDARESQYALLEAATDFFFRARSDAPIVEAYIADRGVTGTSVHTWRIGYAKDEWRALRDYLHKLGFSDEQMLKAGLIKNADAGKEPYDVFRDRVMFPIADSSGRIIAFSGRTLKQDPAVPKYVNSPETELFLKSHTLYGYDKAKQGIRHYDFSLIVEGQFDLVLSHQAGYTNAVAVSGTALTPHHLILLERLSSRVVLALDADRAGISAMRRSALPMLERGMDVKVARMEGGKDPADIIRHNPADFKKFVGHSVHVIEFLLTILREQGLDERVFKLRVREEITPLIAAIPDRIDRDHFVGVVATAIGASKNAVSYEVERQQEKRESEHRHQEPGTTTGTQLSNTEPVESNAEPLSKREAGLRAHLEALASLLPEETTWLAKRITEELERIKHATEEADTENTALVVNAALFNAESYLEKISKRELNEDVAHQLMKLAEIVGRERLAQLRKKIEAAEAVGDTETALSLLGEVKFAESLIKDTLTLEPPSSSP